MRGKKWLALLAVALMLLGMVAMQVSATEHTHDYSVEVVVAGDCTTDRREVHTCKICGDTKIVETKAPGHNWDVWTIEKHPTCIAEGLQKRVCKNNAAHVETSAIAKVDHVMTQWYVDKAADCFNKGIERRNCTTCDTKNETRDIPVRPHAWGQWQIEKNPSCETTGLQFRVCTWGCGVPREEQVVAAIGSHDWGQWQVEKNATCLTDGNQYKICQRCSKKENQVVKALGHDWGAWVTTKNPTCITEGAAERVCKRDASHKQSDVIKALGKDQPAGHNKFTAWKKTLDPTCSAVGKESRTCDDCKRVETRDIAKIPHVESGIWEEARQPNLNEKGLRVMNCKVCGAKMRSQTFAPAGYTYEMPTFAFGPMAGQANPSLSGASARVVYINMQNEGTFSYPLVSEDGWNIGTVKVTVAGGTIRVSLEKASEPTVFRNRYWNMFQDAAGINGAKLMAPHTDSLPFDQTVKVDGESCWIVVRTDANYYKGRQNQQFSDALMNLNGTGSYADEVQAALDAIGGTEQ